MTREDHILVRSVEECAELAQRLTKALVFGMEERWPVSTGGDGVRTNRDLIIAEYTDLVAIMEMAGFPLSVVTDAGVAIKQAKVIKFLEYSRQCGRLDDIVPTEPLRDAQIAEEDQ